MPRRGSDFQIFAERDATDFLERTRSSVRLSVDKESENYILNVNEETYLDYLVERHSIDPLELLIDQVYVSSYETDIPAEQFPFDFHVRPGKSYKKQVIVYHVPFSGNAELLRCIPNPRLLSSVSVRQHDNEITFEIVDFRNDPETIKSKAAEALRIMKKNYENLRGQVDSYNDSVRDEARKALQDRKEDLLRKNDVIAALGVPIKTSDDVPETFSVPSTRAKKKISVTKPEVREKGFTPEPTLDKGTYNQILRAVHDVGKQFGSSSIRVGSYARRLSG